MKLIDYLLIIWIFTCYTQVRNNLIQCAKDCGEIVLFGMKSLLFPVKLILSKKRKKEWPMTKM